MGNKFPAWLYQYRTFVGPPEKYDIVGALQFCLLIFLGLREQNDLLDVGCGSLRSGRFFITYLEKGHYFGIEPEQWLIEEGIKNEIGNELLNMKQPEFSNNSSYNLGVFDRKFNFILAHSIFSHAPQKDITKCLSEVKSVMKPESIFAASFIEGKENYSGDDWVYPSGIAYTLDHMIGLVEDQGLACIPIDWPHPNLQKWLGIVNRGKEDIIPDLNDVTAISRLQSEIKFKNDEVTKLIDKIRHLEKANSELKSNPYVRMALRVSNFVTRLKIF